MRQAAIFLATLCFLGGWKTLASAGDERELVFLGGDRPIVLRLQVYVDGLPLHECYEAAVDRSLRQLFRWLDRNGDGALDAQEARYLPSPRFRNQGNFPVNVASNFAALDTDGDGKISLSEFLGYYRTFEGGPWQTRQHPVVASQALSAALLRRADRNGDSKLDATELAGMEKLLDELDQDQDELLTEEEIIGRRSATTASSSPRSAIQFCAPDETAKLLIDRSDTPLRLTLEIRLGTRKQGEKVIHLSAVSETLLPWLKVTSQTDHQIVLTFGNKRLVLRTAEEARENLIAAARREWELRFEDLDVGGKGFLTASQTQADREFAQLFGAINRKGSGQLDKQVLLEWFREVYEPQLQVQYLRTMLHFSGEGHGLFDSLDTNRDGRLSRRELRQAPALLATYDRNNDGMLEQEENPHEWVVVFTHGRSEQPREGDVYPGLPQDRQLTAPLWFRQMDRNRDGNISPREFLGMREQFKQLDTDGDGLISREEAMAASSFHQRR